MNIDVILLRYILEEAEKIRDGSKLCWKLTPIVYRECGCKFSEDEINYTIEQIIRENEFVLFQICGNLKFDARDRLMAAKISGITFQGRRVLSMLQNNTVWNKIKNTTKKINNNMFAMLCEIANEYAKELINSSNIPSKILNSIEFWFSSINK